MDLSRAFVHFWSMVFRYKDNVFSCRYEMSKYYVSIISPYRIKLLCICELNNRNNNISSIIPEV